jgi:hypothetical protein
MTSSKVYCPGRRLKLRRFYKEILRGTGITSCLDYRHSGLLAEGARRKYGIAEKYSPYTSLCLLMHEVCHIPLVDRHGADYSLFSTEHILLDKGLSSFTISEYKARRNGAEFRAVYYLCPGLTPREIMSEQRFCQEIQVHARQYVLVKHYLGQEEADRLLSKFEDLVYYLAHRTKFAARIRPQARAMLLKMQGYHTPASIRKEIERVLGL